MLARAVLGLTGLMFAGYGLVSIFFPTIPAGYIGLGSMNASTANEVVAMYGGLQAAMGVLFLYSAVRVEHQRTGLRLLVLLIGGLASARVLGLLAHGPTAYNLGAVGYEIATVVLGIVALRRTAPNQEAVA